MASHTSSALVPVYSHIAYPFQLVRGEGLYVFDTEGRKYLDLYGGHCVSCLGHSPARVMDAINRQGRELMFYSNLAPMPVREEAAARLIDFASSAFTKVFFCNSGGEANENALKIAVKATGRKKVAAFAGGFHGRTMLALTATDNKKWHETYSAFVGKVVQLTPNDYTSLELIDNDCAAVILEPIQSIGGVTSFDFDFLKALKDACTAKGAKLIFDEVQTGVGRTGAPFVSGHCGVQPDMATLAKGLAGGFPIGAVLMTEEIAAGIVPGDLGATFGAGPLAMAGMCATLSEIKRNNLMANAKEVGDYAHERFDIPQIEKVNGRGLLLGLILKKEAKPVQYALFEKGIITGLNSNPKLLHLLPPLTLGKEHIDLLYDGLMQIL